jgi:hypothetical protein
MVIRFGKIARSWDPQSAIAFEIGDWFPFDAPIGFEPAVEHWNRASFCRARDRFYRELFPFIETRRT